MFLASKVRLLSAAATQFVQPCAPECVCVRACVRACVYVCVWYAYYVSSPINTKDELTTCFLGVCIFKFLRTDESLQLSD